MKIALSGAAGRMGRVLRRPLLKAGHMLVCSDRVAIEPMGDAERWITGDLADAKVADDALAGCEVLIHLAGTPNEQAFERVIENNHRMLHAVFEAARRQRLRRVVYASSNHAFGLHPVTRKLRLNDAYRPDGFYGLSKVWGEALGRMYWEKHGIECVALRIGTCLGLAPRNRRELSTWLGTEDWIRLVLCALEAEAVAFAPVWGVSANRRAWVDLTEANAIGFRPQQDAEAYAATALSADVAPDPIADRYQGGAFVTVDWTPDEQRPGF